MSSRMPGQRVQGGVDGRQVLNGHNRFAIIAIHRTGRYVMDAKNSVRAE